MAQYSGMWTLSQAQAAMQAGNWTNLPATSVEFFIVGGAGAGGGSNVSGAGLTTAGGGGGGGGVLIGTATVVPNTPMVITVGAGGTFTNLSYGGNGANSSIYSVAQGTAYTAFGGQGGGHLGTMNPLDGGCGGGGSPGSYVAARLGGWPGGNGYQNGPFNDAGQGFQGGAGMCNSAASTGMWGGGGGGAGGRGHAAGIPAPRAGVGGPGITWCGAPSANGVYYDGQYGIGGGGAGRVYGSEGQGAGYTSSSIYLAGGGGHADNPGRSGVPNLGMGGGGNGGSGGSGTVMIRYRDTFRPPVSTSGTLTSVVEYGWRNFRWTASGDIIF